MVVKLQLSDSERIIWACKQSMAVFSGVYIQVFAVSSKVRGNINNHSTKSDIEHEKRLVV